MTNNKKYKPVYIEGNPYVVRLLTSDEWDRVIDIVGANDDLLHYSEYPFWVQDKGDDRSSLCSVRGGHQARTKESYWKTDRGPLVGYRPCLEPLNPISLNPDPNLLSHLNNGSTVRMGSLCVHESPIEIPTTGDSEYDIRSYYLGPIQIGDTPSEKDRCIQWVKAGDLLVADRNLLKNISWHQLDMFGLVSGVDEKNPTKSALEPNKPYTKKDLSYHHYYNGLRTNLQDMLENACFQALLGNIDYALYKDIQGLYSLSQVGGLGNAEARFGSNLVAVASPVANYRTDEANIYIQPGPAWVKANKPTPEINTLEDLLKAAIERSAKQHNLNLPPEKEKAFLDSLLSELGR